jgi:hypothetical protein
MDRKKGQIIADLAFTKTIIIPLCEFPDVLAKPIIRPARNTMMSIAALMLSARWAAIDLLYLPERASNY